MAEASLHLTSLGSAALQPTDPSGSLVPLLGPGKPLALLVYLAHAPDRSATRDELLDLLWAHVEPEKARATLRQTLYGLRNLLGDAVLSVDSRYVRLSEMVHIDTDDFWAAIRAGDAAGAVSFYRGRFLPDLGLPGGEGFEEWADGERVRLERAYLRAAEALVRDPLDRGHAGDALRLARTLRDTYPFRQSLWRLLLEALDAAGEALSLRVEVDALERVLAAESLVPEPATLARLRASRSVVGGVSAGDSTALTAELVGREREFSTLVRLWESSRIGIPRQAHIVAPAGFGKTRLLTDFALRVRALRGRVVVVRAHPGERMIRYALAADLAEALGALPGASAISPAAAEALVSLAPALSSHFSVGTSTAAPDDVLRQRVLALSELVSAVSEEQPLAVIVDDLHWSDPESRHVVLGLITRLRGHSLLITASRPTGQDLAGHADSARLALEPLSDAAVRAMIESIGLSLPPHEMNAVADALHATSHGSPLLILQTLELGRDRGILARDGSALHCPDVAALTRHVRSGDALATRVASLDADARAVLAALAVAEMPLPVGTLAAAVAQPSGRVEDLLTTLASRGMATADGRGWEPAHDAIGDTVQRLVSPEQRNVVRRALGRALLSTATSADHYRAAARQLAEAEASTDLVWLLKEWIRVRLREGDRGPVIDLAVDLLGAADRHDYRARALVKMLPLRERLSPRERRALWLVPVAAVLIIGSLTLDGGRDSQLHIVATPLSVELTVDRKLNAFQPTPVIERRDGRGRLIEAEGESVMVRVTSGNGRLTGPTRVPLVRGRAVFPGTGLIANGPIVLEFSTTRGDARVRVPFSDVQHSRDRPLALISAELNGKTLDPRNPELRVRPGSLVTGFVRAEYTSTFGNSTVWFGATPTWGDPATSYTSFGGLSTPTTRRGRTEEVRFTAPETPGRYYYLLAWAPESNAQFLFSATNWTMGTPKWHDGNDLATTPADSIEKAMRTGWLQARVYKDLEGVRGYHIDEVGAAAIRVIVGSTSAAATSLRASRALLAAETRRR